MLMLQCGAEHFVLPVSTLAQDGRVGIEGVGRYLTERHHVIIILRVFAKVHHVDAAVLARYCEHAVVREFGFASLTMLGGDEHDAVGALCTVDGGCGCILEDFHADDVGGVDGRQRGDGGYLTVAEGVAQTEICA